MAEAYRLKSKKVKCFHIAIRRIHTHRKKKNESFKRKIEKKEKQLKKKSEDPVGNIKIGY